MTPPPDDAPMPDLASVDEGRAHVRITLRLGRWRKGEAPAAVRIRRALKYLLRVWRLVAVRIEVVPTGGPPLGPKGDCPP